MYFDRFDICDAYFLFFVYHHEGQGSEKYRRLCKLQTYYTLASALSDRSDLTENAREIFDKLVAEEMVS